ncbi:MAG: bifunctional 2-polyprenyl-6-hydroxyphenol methylase/3-demethylubiquinol 3-O-methyltransferase UbiG [Deltaproteobacteria bacterium]|nr:bifunctional 2-polyprenyl-6-hydroxyphenol methylase/3-demethylubiquinol 3-O-methyltransferase UbiG [Deltaproteobacteria bacterium]
MTTESEKFDKFGGDWWNSSGRLFSLHLINPLRFDYFAKKAGDLKGARVLDIGCGGGLLSERFALSGALVTGIDLSLVAIDAAKKHADEAGLSIDYRVLSPSGLLMEDPEKFDVIVCAEVLEHVDDLKGFLADALKMLKSGGIFFFGTINKTVRARLLAVFAAENILHMIPNGTHDFNKFIKPSVLVRILKENNVETMEIKGMSLDTLKLEFKISRDTSMNYLGYGVKGEG